MLLILHIQYAVWMEKKVFSNISPLILTRCFYMYILYYVASIILYVRYFYLGCPEYDLRLRGVATS